MRHDVDGCIVVSQIKLIKRNRSSESTGTHTVTVTTTVDVIVGKLPLSCRMLRTLGECLQWLACLEDCDTQTTQP